MAKQTKKLKALDGKVDSNKNYGVTEAITLVRSLATANITAGVAGMKRCKWSGWVITIRPPCAGRQGAVG